MARRTQSDVWEDIARQAILDAESVDCLLEDFVAGLKDIEITIRERRELSESEVDAESDLRVEDDGA